MSYSRLPASIALINCCSESRRKKNGKTIAFFNFHVHHGGKRLAFVAFGGKGGARSQMRRHPSLPAPRAFIRACCSQPFRPSPPFTVFSFPASSSAGMIRGCLMKDIAFELAAMKMVNSGGREKVVWCRRMDVEDALSGDEGITGIY
ncbi:uncharacterized protein EV420DRAFT_1486504 [Desarmillaria tabescens]|uniref:Uncharacterized protein n=1 Tax=Armillaria tabescens TaxID=1929756 RepID=A0AA39JAH2_ARMTA|nr:uncharacterized protein EV420DRAFT_1486504 [Desarmillaria tabescens]KAK0439043.1 hypothetical protein EV420DRAFT_1486504 [Desarmillaria tabescens]